MGETVVLTLRDGLAILRLNRPRKMNALRLEDLRRILSLLAELRDRGLKGLILHGSGGNFCAGGDLGDLAEASPEEFQTFVKTFEEVIKALYTFPAFTAAAFEGNAMGGGLALGLACDIRYASPTFRWGFSGVRFGAVQPLFITALLFSILGPDRARRWVIAGHRGDAREALALGLVDAIVENPLQAAKERLIQLSEIPSHALALQKEILGQVLTNWAKGNAPYGEMVTHEAWHKATARFRKSGKR